MPVTGGPRSPPHFPENGVQGKGDVPHPRIFQDPVSASKPGRPYAHKRVTTESVGTAGLCGVRRCTWPFSSHSGSPRRAPETSAARRRPSQQRGIPELCLSPRHLLRTSGGGCGAWDAVARTTVARAGQGCAPPTSLPSPWPRAGGRRCRPCTVTCGLSSLLTTRLSAEGPGSGPSVMGAPPSPGPELAPLPHPPCEPGTREAAGVSASPGPASSAPCHL